MGRFGISYQEVANAALTIQGQGNHPTVDRVRELLGTGSKSTIARYLKQWKAQQDFPGENNEVPSELNALVKGLWERIKTEAESKIEKAQQQADEAIDTLQESLFQEQKKLLDLQRRQHELETQLHEKNHLNTSLQQMLDDESKTNLKLIERHQAAIQQMESQQLEQDRLHQLLSHVQANLEHYQHSMQKMREEQQFENEKRKNAYEQELNALKSQLQEIISQSHLHEKDKNQLQTELKLLSQQQELLKKEKDFLQQELQEKRSTESVLQSNNAQLLNHQQKLQEDLSTKSQMITDFEKKFAVLSQQLDTLKNSLSEAQDKIQLLHDEKLFLTKEKAHLEGQLKQLELITEKNRVAI